MKKFIVATLALVALLFTLSGCAKQVNYLDYVSEKRCEIYIYADDDTTVTVYCCEKEQPYNADGIKGDVCPVVEIFVTLPKNPREVEVELLGHGGDMNYRSVQGDFYLSFTAEPFTQNSVDVKLTCDGESKTYSALTVKYDGVLTCEQAVLCAVENNPQLFESMTQNGLFDGEIYVRLLHDEGCYYYVGVCNKDKHISAFLIDGERGKVITTKEIDL
ncbi:MAG: hypothetical protein K2K80_03995 [Clostridia bacterium]|nr:hypothetical protein [Clostridia bacterium]